jgi:hypothetical protein
MGAFRKVWDRACKELGLHTQVWNERKQAMVIVRPRVHDFRRSGQSRCTRENGHGYQRSSDTCCL